DDAERMPLFVHAVQRPLAVHRLAVELARQPDGEIADVDDLLDLAFALAADLAHLVADEGAEVGLVLAAEQPELPHDLATPRGGNHAPRLEGAARRRDDGLVVGGGGGANGGDR